MYVYIYICLWYGIDDTGIRDILYYIRCMIYIYVCKYIYGI